MILAWFLSTAACSTPIADDAAAQPRGSVTVTLDTSDADLPDDREVEFRLWARAEGGSKHLSQQTLEPGVTAHLRLVGGDFAIEAWYSWVDPDVHSGDSGGPDGGSTYVQTDCEADEPVTVWPGERNEVELVVLCSSMWLD